MTTKQVTISHTTIGEPQNRRHDGTDATERYLANLETDENASTPTELLAYYRFRIQQFEGEREHFLERFQVLDTTHGEVHRLRWDAKGLKEQVGVENLKQPLGGHPNCHSLSQLVTSNHHSRTTTFLVHRSRKRKKISVTPILSSTPSEKGYSRSRLRSSG
jgi:hypothetical protein